MRLWWCPERPTALARRARTDQLLRTVLAPTVGLAPVDLAFGREPKGRPFLRHDGAPDFNLTDTRGGGVIALCRRGRVGVDIERLDRVPPVSRLAPRWFSVDEAAQLAAMPDDDARRAFLRLWTAKEASCKATGTGIFGFLAAWCFDPLSEQPQATVLPDDAGEATRWTFLRVMPAATHTVVVSVRDAGFRRVEGFTLVE